MRSKADVFLSDFLADPKTRGILNSGQALARRPSPRKEDMSIPVLRIALICCAIGSIPPAAASLIYAVDDTRLYSIDPDTHAVSVVLQLPFSHGFNISAGPVADSIYFLNDDPPAWSMYRYSLGTGAVFPIGATGNATVSLGEGRDGFLYAVGESLVRVDPTTGQWSAYGPPLQLQGDLATSPAGVTYGAASSIYSTTGAALVQIDRTTGNWTSLMELPSSTWGLAFTLDGRCWASSIGGIYSVDLSAGTYTLEFNPPGIGIMDLASEPEHVPELPGLAVFGAVGAALLRRRR